MWFLGNFGSAFASPAGHPLIANKFTGILQTARLSTTGSVP
jgi:hypothetical protein